MCLWVHLFLFCCSVTTKLLAPNKNVNQPIPVPIENDWCTSHSIFCWCMCLISSDAWHLIFQLENLEQETVKWCRQILRNSPTAVRVLKSALNAVDDGHSGLQVPENFAGLRSPSYLNPASVFSCPHSAIFIVHQNKLYNVVLFLFHMHS